jgi:CHASE1-domain containing sensor protein
VSEPASVQLPRVNVSTIVGVGIPVLMFFGALLSVFYTYVVSKTQVELNQIAIEKRMDANDETIKLQTNAIRAMEDRLSHMDDTIANLKIQATPKH